MSPQVRHGLGQVLVMMFLASLGVLVESQTGILQNLGIDPIFYPIAGAGLAAAVRYAESLIDAGRARAGDIKPADVGYDQVVAAEYEAGVY